MRRKQTTLTALAFFAALGVFAGCDDNEEDRDAGIDAGAVRPDAAIEPTIAQLAVQNPDLSLFVSAAERAGIGDTLATPGPFTVFAPTNEAFAASGITMRDIDALSQAELQQILGYHIIAGTEVTAAEITNGPALTSADLTLFLNKTGGVVTINGGNTVKGGANVVTADVQASNGVVHLIDRVLLPPNIPMLATYGGLTTLATAIETAGLTDELSAAGPFTVFAPTNEAFAALPAIPQGEALVSVLTYHVVARELSANEITKLNPPQASTLSVNRWGDPLTVVFSTTDDTLHVNDATVILPNLRATNGTVHVIDRVLIPPNVLEMAELVGLTALVGAIDGAADLDGTTLAEALAGEGPFTVFGPTNEAFAAKNAFLATLTPAQVRDVLLFHVLDPATYTTPLLAADLPAGVTSVHTLLGEPVTLDTTVTPPTIDGARIIRTDLVVTNGVLHVIDAVMIPPSLE